MSAIITSRRYGLHVTLGLVASLLLTALVYWPAMHGGYAFDDYANIVENGPLHVHSLDWESLRAAAWSSPSSLLVRPLSMLSFAVDWYIGDGDPFVMKQVNLAIHLANALLLFPLLRRIIRRADAQRSSDAVSSHADYLALVVTAAWALAPINFTAVGYIVQRMESLCQLFVLAGLLGYILSRERMLAGRTNGFAGAIASIGLGTAVGVLAKESALLLPIYAFIVEWVLFRFAQANEKKDLRVIAAYALAAVFGAAAAIWAMKLFALDPRAWASRTFTLCERLLSEPRILFDYVQWSLLPTPDRLALYHDQVPVSTSLSDPATTWLSIVGLIAAAATAILIKSRYPLVAIGVLWFLGAHLLTATIIPLELIFEHRNYFASIGLYLAVFSLLLPPGATMIVARTTACLALLAGFAAVTWERAQDWRNPIVFAITESEKNPTSPRTAYEVGRAYVVLSRYQSGSPLIPKAVAALEHAATMPGSDALPDQGLLILSGRLHLPADPKVWKRLQRKLAEQPLSAQNIAALHSLSQCAVGGDCDLMPEEMVATFVTALQHAPGSTQILSIYANYAINVLHDDALAIDLARESVRVDGHSVQLRKNLLLLLQATGRVEEARSFYRQTLQELSNAREDRAFREWSERLLAGDASAQSQSSMSESIP